MDFAAEKNNLKKILIDSRMEEISYSETINLYFITEFYDYEGKQMQFVLILDAPCWFGDREEWTFRVDALKENNDPKEIEDCLVIFELTRLRYNNLIQVRKVDFYENYLTIEFEEKNVLYVSYCAQSDYAWVLEEVSSKPEEDRMSICCQGNMLCQNNMP